jgi:hypothetical protein
MWPKNKQKRTDVSLSTTLRRLNKLMRDWPGEPIDAEGSVRLVQADDHDANAVPVYGCFNATHEAPALGKAMGEDQPLVSMRSLHLVLNVTPDIAPLLDELAGHYATTLLRRFGQRPCIVLGVCQGASIAWRVAVRLLAAGVPVLRFATLDAETRLPFPGFVRLLFGAESTLYNPFLDTRPEETRPPIWYWERAFGGCDWHVVPSAYGQHFAPANVKALASAILAPQPGTSTMCRPQSAPIPWRAIEFSENGLWIDAEVPTGLSGYSDLAVLPIWRSASGAQYRVSGPDWIVPLEREKVWRCHLANPGVPRGAKVIPVLCAKGHGPLVWPLSMQPPLRAEKSGLFERSGGKLLSALFERPG